MHNGPWWGAPEGSLYYHIPYLFGQNSLQWRNRVALSWFLLSLLLYNLFAVRNNRTHHLSDQSVHLSAGKVSPSLTSDSFGKKLLTDAGMEQVCKWYKDLKYPHCFLLDWCLSKWCAALDSMHQRPIPTTKYIYCNVCHKTWCKVCLNGFPTMRCIILPVLSIAMRQRSSWCFVTTIYKPPINKSIAAKATILGLSPMPMHNKRTGMPLRGFCKLNYAVQPVKPEPNGVKDASICNVQPVEGTCVMNVDRSFLLFSSVHTKTAGLMYFEHCIYCV
jgi:hypothetical protein